MLPLARTLIHHQGCLLLGFESADVGDAIVEGLAPEERARHVFHRAVFGALVIGAGAEAFKFLDRNDVDHTRHGVRPVQRRAAVQHHLHATDGDLGEAGGHQRAECSCTVNQSERGVLTQTAQVEAAVAGLCAVSAAQHDVHHVGVLRVAEIADIGSHARGTRLEQVFLSHGIHGGVLGKSTVADVGTCNHHFFHFGISLCLNDNGKCEGSNETGMDQMTQLPASGEVKHIYLRLLAVAARTLHSLYYLDINSFVRYKALLDYHWRLHALGKSGTTIYDHYTLWRKM